MHARRRDAVARAFDLHAHRAAYVDESRLRRRGRHGLRARIREARARAATARMDGPRNGVLRRRRLESEPATRRRALATVIADDRLVVFLVVLVVAFVFAVIAHARRVGILRLPRRLTFAAVIADDRLVVFLRAPHRTDRRVAVIALALATVIAHAGLIRVRAADANA